MDSFSIAPRPEEGKPKAVVLPAGESVPKFGATDRALSDGFVSNVREFLTERPVKAPRNIRGAFKEDVFGAGFLDNLKEYFKARPKRLSGEIAKGMTVDWQPWYRTFYQNLRDAIAPPKLPPLKVTSQPVNVRSIWSRDEAFGPSQIAALAVHIGLIVLLVVPIYRKITNPTPTVIAINVGPDDISPYTAKIPAGKNVAHGGGGGGERNPVPASKGKLPKFAPMQLTPPMAVIRNPNPRLTATPTLIGPPDLKLPSPNLPNYGDPLAKILTDSNGPGSGGGIGSGSGGGIGSGTGGGLGPGSGGGTGGGVYNAGTGGYGVPSCLYCPDPKYSEEARKVKFMGTVVVQAIVNVDGHATNIQVVKDPGMGLGEKALEAVKTWQFKPALGPNGKPAATMVTIEVAFRLL
ncbi:MAG TPA: energy transducer TonB [Methylomirabilota bacterium]|nr:energy transducer TonB [Methylomirabilota bacterium]